MAVQPQTVPRITPEALKARMDTGQAMIVVDVRQPGSYFESPLTILGAMRLPPDEIARRSQDIPRGDLVVTFCT